MSMDIVKWSMPSVCETVCVSVWYGTTKERHK